MGLPSPDTEAEPCAVRWEYLTEFLFAPKLPAQKVKADQFQEDLNYYGTEGWELVAFYAHELDLVVSCNCIFKRRVDDGTA